MFAISSEGGVVGGIGSGSSSIGAEIFFLFRSFLGTSSQQQPPSRKTWQLSGTFVDGNESYRRNKCLLTGQHGIVLSVGQRRDAYLNRKMSLPESEKELLLSASIDDALSPEEQEVLDRWFREDPAAGKRRDEMAALVTSVREAYRPLRQGIAVHKPLGREFADSIVDSAIAEAVSEKLPPSHPLVRIGRGQRVNRGSAVIPAATWSRFAAIAGLAASIIGGVFFATRGGKNDGPAGSLALLDPATVIERPVEIVQPSPSLELADWIAADPVDTADRVAADLQPMRSVPLAEAPAGLPSAADIAEPATAAEKVVVDDAFQLAAVMIVSVELTEAGRQSLALLAALRAADIRIGANGVVSDQVVSGLQQSAVVQASPDDQSAKLYFVEASARQIDQFLMKVMADKDSFASIGLSIADDPPLLASIGRWRPGDAERDASQNPVGQRLAADAKPVSVARDLVLSDGKPLAIDRGPAVIPMDRTTGTAGLMLPAPANPDSTSTTAAKSFSSQLLLLVR